MLKIYSQEMLDEYLKDDYILCILKENEIPNESQIRTQKWLLEMDNKRMIYADVYGDLLEGDTGKSVLDVGGGYNSLTKVLSRNSDYTLIDFFAHSNGGRMFT